MPLSFRRMCYPAKVTSVTLGLISYRFKRNRINFHKLVVFLLHPRVHTAPLTPAKLSWRLQKILRCLSLSSPPTPWPLLLTNLTHWAFTGPDKYPISSRVPAVTAPSPGECCPVLGALLSSHKN